MSALSCKFRAIDFGYRAIEQQEDPPAGICLVTNIADGGGK